MLEEVMEVHLITTIHQITFGLNVMDRRCMVHVKKFPAQVGLLYALKALPLLTILTEQKQPALPVVVLYQEHPLT